MQAAADDIKRWCDNWRMAVNGSKAEIVLFNYNSNDPFEIALNSDICNVKTSTKSLGIILDKKTIFKERAERSVAEALRIRAAITSKCTNRWCLSLTFQVYRYRTTFVPQTIYGAPLCYHKITQQLKRFQNNVMGKIFKHGPSPSIEACEVLTGLPPIDCESIAIKFASKIRQNNDLVRDTHLKSISKPRSRANSLEPSFKRYSRFLNKETILEYTNDQIAGFFTDQWRRRWKRGFQNSFLTNFYASVPNISHVSPMICGDSYTANKICELLIGISLKLADMK